MCCWNERGEIIRAKRDVLNKWKQYFKVLDGKYEETEISTGIISLTQSVHINNKARGSEENQSPIKEEFQKATRKLNNNRLLRLDQITAELIKVE
jgi:hypothetical protein